VCVVPAPQVCETSTIIDDSLSDLTPGVSGPLYGSGVTASQTAFDNWSYTLFQAGRAGRNLSRQPSLPMLSGTGL
jgi:hypothetical protein